MVIAETVLGRGRERRRDGSEQGGTVLEVLDKKHPDYHDRQKMWQRYWDFYAGGEQLRRPPAAEEPQP